jgi:hypothetical protein
MNRAASQRIWILLGVSTGIAAVGASVLFWFDPSSGYDFYPVCLFHRTTGLLCPACGSLRALHQLLHGNFAAALRFNALLVFSLPILIWFSSRNAINALRHQAASIDLKWVWLFVGVGVAFGVLRNLPLGALALLRP